LLDDAVAAFLDSVTERGFDEPFMALLRAAGFERVRLIHGSAEFGKDIIAQRDREQWAFQSKAGNISQGEWRQGTGQLDELRLSRLGHPDFDLARPRRCVLVLTGRLTGNAPLGAQEYNTRARGRDEPEIEVWDRDVLLGLMSGDASAVLRGSVDGQLLALLGAIDQRDVSLDTIELFSRRWTSWEPDRLAGLGMVEAAIACERLRGQDRLDLACHLTLCAVRSAYAVVPDLAADNAAAQAAAQLFEVYGGHLWATCDQDLLGPDAMIRRGGASAWITFPLRSLRLAELLSLLALRTRASDPDTAEAISRWVDDFVTEHPAASHLIGDRYATSLIPIALVLWRRNPEHAADFMHRATVWLCDRYERGEPGLASVDAEPEEEVARLLGGPFEVVRLDRRSSSQAGAVLLDVAALLGLGGLYADIRNDMLVVGIQPDVLLTADGPDRFLRTGLNNRWQLNADYADELEEAASAAPHLQLAAANSATLAEGSAWVLLAVSAALRDRHFPSAIRRLAKP
jgi:hypothetical protein